MALWDLEGSASGDGLLIEEEGESEEPERSGSGEPNREDTVAALKDIFSNKLAWLLAVVPVAWALQWQGEAVAPVWKFAANFGSIVPLAWLISEATEHLEKLVGPTIGVLLNSTFGNMVEIILSVTAIRAGLVKVVQSSLLGAMLMNLLFVTGCCFVIAGWRRRTAEFNTNSASYQMSLLGVATVALVVPTELAHTDEWSSPQDRLCLSRFVAAFLGLMYVQWLVFNMCTHSTLFLQKGHTHRVKLTPSDDDDQKGDVRRQTTLKLHVRKDGTVEEQLEDVDAEEDEGPRLTGIAASLLLLGATVLVAFHCDFLVESIEPVTRELGIKQAFVATVLLPMVGNFSEEIAAVSIASKGKIDLAMGVAIGSATQIALLVVPIVVFLGWSMDQPFDLDFEVFQTRILIVSLLVASLALRDGHANWLKGTLLITAYAIVGSSFWFIHDREFASEGAPIRVRGNLTAAAA